MSASAAPAQPDATLVAGPEAAPDLADVLAGHLAGNAPPAGCLAVLTGAGCSTASGIPDYRDDQGQWKRPQPMSHQRFMGGEADRLRYWARSFIGWPRVREAVPNATHRAIAQLQAAGWAGPVISQNVDGLHRKALAEALGGPCPTDAAATPGRPGVIELHGRLDRVVCMACGEGHDREAVQQRLAAAFPHWQASADAPMAAAAPDGDAVTEPAITRDAIEALPVCTGCGGVLKPDVVFFGDGVPQPRVQACYDAVAEAGALLVVGSSLMVRSAMRFVDHARRHAVPVYAVNLGRTRADGVLHGRLAARCEEVLPQLAQRLAGPALAAE